MKKEKQVLSLILTIIMMFGIFVFPPLKTDTAFAESSISANINALRSKFPHGKYWNHLTNNYHNHNGPYESCNDSRCNNPDGYTSTPCASHNSAAGVGVYDCNSFDGGIQCWGFANKVFYDIHGVYASSVSNRTDTANVSVGDWIRLLDESHSAVVIARNGNTLTVVECNLDVSGAQYNCYIRWDKTYSLSSVNYFKHSDSVVPSPAPIDYTTITETRYYLKNKATGKYMTTDGGAKEELTNVSVAAYANQDSFHWDCVYDTLGCKLSPQGCSNFLNPYSDTPALGTNINLFRLVGGDSTQRWQFSKVGNGYIIHMVYNPYLTVGVGNSNNVELKNYNKSDDYQIWYLECLTHTWNSGSVTTSATCTSSGVKTYTCTLCGATKTETIASLGHNWGSWTRISDTQHQRVCSRDSSHKETANHTWNSGVVTKAATCTTSGTKTYTCTTCNATKTETIAVLGHDYQVSEIIAGTCLSPEQIKYTCSRCGDVKTEDLTGEWTDWSTTQPTESDNYIVESKKQYRYRDKQIEYGFDTSRTGWTATPYKWVSDGSGTIDHAVSWPSDGDHAFDTSNALYTKYNKTVNSYQTDQWKRTIDSDVTIGYIYYHWCRNEEQDADWRYHRIIYGAPYNNWTTFHAFFSTENLQNSQPEGYDPGYSSAQPSVCTDSYNWIAPRVEIKRASYTDYRMQYQYTCWTDYSDWQDDEVSSSSTREVETQTVYRYKLKNSGTVAHVWNEGIVTTEPTCTAEGVRTLTCTVCGTTTTETIPALGHQEKAVAGKAATCTEAGLTGGVVCARCDTVLTEQTEIPALGHEEHFVPGTPATCNETGLTDGVICVRCNTVLTAQTEIPALGHTFGDWTAIIEATCTTAGEEERACIRCSLKETRTVDPLGHTPGEAVKENVTEATCTTAGGYDSIIYCMLCGNVLSSEHRDVEALGHNFGAWTVTKPATESEEGIETRTCDRCPETETRIIPKLEPTDADLDIEIDSVMTQAGKTVTIDVYVTKAAPVTYLCLTPSYDKTVLTLSEIKNGELFDTLEKGSSLLFSSDTNVTATGKLVTLTFTVAENAEEGEYPIRLNLREAYDYDEDIVTVSVKPGAITVQNFIYGDVTGDGLIDGRDLVRLRKYLANLDEETGVSTVEIFPGADCTGDGTVDGRDLIRLRKYLANLDEDTGESTIHLGP